jgi:hypothetical protein
LAVNFVAEGTIPALGVIIGSLFVGIETAQQVALIAVNVVINQLGFEPCRACPPSVAKIID